MKIDKLYIHPIKSLLPVPVSNARITPNGLQHDRTFMLIRIHPDGTITNMTVKETSELCLFQPTLSMDNKSVLVSFKNSNDPAPVTIPLEPEFPADTKSYDLNICGTSTTGYDMGSETSLFFSTHLGYPVQLIHIGPSHRATLDALTPRPSPDPHPQGISFADAAPILLATQASLEDVSSRTDEKEPFSVTKFRPNIFVDTSGTGVDAYDEEFWADVEVVPKAKDQEDEREVVNLEMTFNTPRCMSINVDYETGKQMPSDKQIFKKLVKDRRINPVAPYSPCFGRYAFCKQFGATIHVGDEIRVTRRNAERHVPV